MKRAVVIGGGPAGLMAAETLMQAGVAVDLYDAMPSVGRKFLLAGKGGLNLTHSEPLQRFVTRYGSRQPELEKLLADFGPSQLCDWARALGIDTFTGTSGRIFPIGMKAAPLLRAWLHRLRHPGSDTTGVRFHMRHQWLGWDYGSGALRFESPLGEVRVRADAVVLALGGGSWARLGSNGSWLPIMKSRGVAVAPLLPANCGFDIGWSAYFASRFAGQPFKSVAIAFTDSLGRHFERKGEFVATATGIEGSLVYAASALLRDEVMRSGHALLQMDLLPDLSPQRVLAQVSHPRGSRSLSSHLKSRLGLDGIKMAVLHEVLGKEGMNQSERLASTIKAVPLRLVAARPLDEAISSAGGIRFEALTDDLMCKALPGVFCAGEMLDWESPTGGYLLTACFASGRRAGMGAVKFLEPGQP